MKKDPLSIMNSMVLNLNLLEPNQEYNINELKFMKDLEMHWNTIKKYLKIISLIQGYAPSIVIRDSKFTIINSDIYNHLNDKEKCVITLFNRKAIDQDSAIDIVLDNIETIDDSIGYIFEKTSDNKYYLNEVGLDLYKSIKQDILDIIYEEKNLDELFFEYKDIFEELTPLLEEFEIYFETNVYRDDTQEGSIMVPKEEISSSNNIIDEKDIIITT